MIRVLHVVNWLRAGGVETQLIRILREYDRAQFHMDVCAIGGEVGYLGDDARLLGAQTILCNKSPNFLSFSRRFTNILSDKNYDVVHSHLEPWGGPIMRGAYRAGVPVRIVEMHHVWPFTLYEGESFLSKSVKAVLAAWGLRWVRRYATHVLAVSKAVLKARWPGRWGLDNVFIWTGGVDTDIFRPAQASRSEEGTPLRIIWVGGLRSVKRVDLQLQVFRQVREAVPEARLVIVGEGDQERPLQRLAQELGITDSVDFLGLRHDVPALLRSATVFLSCSEAEGLPTVLMEAQAVGLPVVASDIEPHREALAPDLHPYIFRHDCLGDAAESIVRILRNERLRSDLARAETEFVSERYCASNQLEILQDYYRVWTESKRCHRV